mgnify:CR=1 FL=1
MPDAESATTDTRRTPRVRRDLRERMSRAVLDDWHTLDDQDIAIFSIRNPDGSAFPEFEVGQYTQPTFLP